MRYSPTNYKNLSSPNTLYDYEIYSGDSISKADLPKNIAEETPLQGNALKGDENFADEGTKQFIDPLTEIYKLILSVTESFFIGYN